MEFRWRCREAHAFTLALALSASVASSACGGEVSRADADAGTDASSDQSADRFSDRTCGKYTIPGDLSSFSPSYVSPKPASAACSAEAIEKALTACLNSASAPATCDAFKGSEATCYGCLFAAGGPFQRLAAGTSRNRGGCVEILGGGLGATSCGGKQQALDQCAFASCSAQETIDECADVATSGLTDPACLDGAAATVCSTYAKSVDGCATIFSACVGSDEDLAKSFCVSE